jgi:hypothetical protein
MTADRRAEVLRLTDAFTDTLRPLISRYAGMEPSDLNVTKLFVQRVREEQARFGRKFASMRTNSDYAGLADTIDAVEKSVNTAADVECARAESNGKVDKGAR